MLVLRIVYGPEEPMVAAVHGIDFAGGQSLEPQVDSVRSAPLRATLMTVLSVVLVAAGCGGGGAAGGTASSAGSGSEQLAAAVLPVVPAVSAGGAVTGILEPASPLRLDAVGPDGAKFHAEFAKGAAPFTVTVTMQPLAGVGGFAGAVEGVTFEPSGVHLLQPAVLTIDGPVANTRTSRAFGFQATESGAVARPAIAAPMDGPMRLLVTHFSGYGAAADGPAEWNIGTITATEARDIIALEDFVIANTYRLLKSHLLSDAEAQQAIDNAMNGIADASQRLGDAALAAAEKGNPDAAAQIDIASAIEVMLASERADELTGQTVDRDAKPRVVEILKTYLTGVEKHCETAHDLTVLTLLHSLSRQAQLLGGDDLGLEQETRRCTAAEVHFTLTINQSLGRSLVSTPAVLEGDARLDVTAPVNLFYGGTSDDVPYKVASTWRFHDNTCSWSATVDDGVFAVLRAALVTAAPPAKPPAVVPPGTATPSGRRTVSAIPLLPITDALVRLSIGHPLVNVTLGSGCNPDPVAPSPFTDIVDQQHPAEAMGSGVYLFKGGFEIPGKGSAVLARRAIDRTTGGLSDGMPLYRSTTLVEIVHSPG